MNAKLKALLQLERLKHSLPVTIFVSLLGAAATQSNPSLLLLFVLLANLCVSWLYFTLRDLQFAPLDVSKQDKQPQNPVATGLISPKTANILLLLVGIIAIVLYALAGIKTLITGVVLLIVVFILNWRKLGLQKRFYLKTSPYHFLVNSFMCLLGSLSLNPVLNQVSLLAIGFVLFILLYASFIDQARQVVSKKTLRIINVGAVISLTLAILLAIAIFIFVALLPYWIVGLFMLLLAIMIVPQIIERRREKLKPNLDYDVFRIAVFRAAAIAMLVHFLVPLVFHFFSQ